MRFVCDSCGQKFRGEPILTATRELCQPCFEGFRGEAAGLMATGSVGGAIAVAGWLPAVNKSVNQPPVRSSETGAEVMPTSFSSADRQLYRKLREDGFSHGEAVDAVVDSM